MPAETPEERVYQQIQQDADYYPPNVYEFLSRFDSLKTMGDEEAFNYIPLTTAQQGLGYQAGFLPFIVGLIPPAANVTGRMLDRSATVGAIEGAAGGVDITTVAYAGGPTNAPPGANFWVQFVAMCNRLKVDPFEMAKVLNCESGIRSSAINWQKTSADGKTKGMGPCKEGDPLCEPFAKGLNQLTEGSAAINGVKDWKNYDKLPPEQQLPMVESFMRRAGVESGMTGATIYALNFAPVSTKNPKADDGSYICYASRKYMDAHGGPSMWPAYYKIDFDSVIKANPGFGPLASRGYITSEDMGAEIKKHPLTLGTIANIQAAMQKLGMAATAPVAEPAPNNPTAFATGGADAAKDAKKYQGKYADKDLNLSALGQYLLLAQKAQANATNAAIQQMANTPPLKMLVNPKSFKFSSEKIQNDGNWGRNGPIIEHWGNQQEKIDGSGKLAAFYAIDVKDTPDGSPGNSPGLTRNARNFSLSYQNFLSLYLIYKNNGGIWLPDYYGNLNALEYRVNLSLVGSVYLYYDNTLYVGSFDNFSITEADDAPFSLEYSFTFTVRAWFLLDRVADPRFSYGAPPARAATEEFDIPTAAPTSADAIEDGGGGAVPLPAAAGVPEAPGYVSPEGLSLSPLKPPTEL